MIDTMNNFKDIIDREAYFSKARDAYQTVLKDEGNYQNLSDDLDADVKFVEVRNEFILIKLLPDGITNIEVKLTLWLNNEKVGYYSYIENEDQEFVDEFLVFS